MLAKKENLARGGNHESRGLWARLLARGAHAMGHDGMGRAVGGSVAIDVQMAVCGAPIGHDRILNRGWGHLSRVEDGS